MFDFKKLAEDLTKITGEENVKADEPLLKHTTFRIGGPAKLFVTPSDLHELREVLLLVKKSGVRYFVMGNGSNLLVSDSGFSGVVISTHRAGRQEKYGSSFGLQDYREYQEEELSCLLQKSDREGSLLLSQETGEKRLILSGSGVLLSALAGFILEKELTGFEFASGIPGTLGGAVAMNAGAYGGEIKDCIIGAMVLAGDDMEERFLFREELELGYRSSRILKENMIVLSALFAFPKGEAAKIRQTMNELNEKRREKQPLNFGSAGSTFKRPEGYFAGKLIEDAGLKGYRVGDVMVSEKHAGFVVNTGNGTFAEAMAVIHHVQETVKKTFGVMLETEVKIIDE